MRAHSWVLDLTKEARRKKAMQVGSRVKYLACPLCGMNKVLGKSPIRPNTDGYILQERVGGGTFSLEDEAPGVWDRLVMSWGNTGPRPNSKVGLGFFLDESTSSKLEDLPKDNPELFEALRQAVTNLYHEFNALSP